RDRRRRSSHQFAGGALYAIRTVRRQLPSFDRDAVLCVCTVSQRRNQSGIGAGSAIRTSGLKKATLERHKETTRARLRQWCSNDRVFQSSRSLVSRTAGRIFPVFGLSTKICIRKSPPPYLGRPR